MPPPPGRYGPTGMNGPFSHFQQPHMQQNQAQTQQQQQSQQQQSQAQQQQSQQQAQHHSSQILNTHMNLPTPLQGAHSGFGPGSTASGSGLTPFSIPNTLGGGSGFGSSGGGIGDGGGGGSGLASHAAQMGFARGAQMQQHQQQQHAAAAAAQLQAHQQGTDGHLAGDERPLPSVKRIREVWKHNLHQEMAVLRRIVRKYPWISMDCEFPGICARPMGQFTSKTEYHYQTLRCNVDLLRALQVGLTPFTSEGELVHPNCPEAINGSGYMNGFPAPCTWQFNFRFSPESEMIPEHQFEMLSDGATDFALQEKQGIDPEEFGALLITSGLVLTDDVHWLSYHSGYDFAFLTKMLLNQVMPDDEEEFLMYNRLFFPQLYDIKYLLRHPVRNNTVNNSPLNPKIAQILAKVERSTLIDEMAGEFGVKRIGHPNQAGSDSLLTGELFWKIKQHVFNGEIDEEKYSGQIWGITAPSSAPTTAAATTVQQTPQMNGGASLYQPASQNGMHTPSTPNNGHVGLSGHGHTPGPHGMGSLTPGGGGGAFGQFSYGK